MWVYAARVRNSRLAISFCGDCASIIVTRHARRVWHAFFTVCRHRGSALLPSEAILTRIHALSRLDLCARWAPLGRDHMQEANFSARLSLTRPRDCGRHLFLKPEREPRPLADQLGACHKFAPWRMQDLRLKETLVYDVKANWKLVPQLQRVLTAGVHPCLNRSRILGADNDAPQHLIGGSMVSAMARNHEPRWQTTPRLFPGLNDERARRSITTRFTQSALSCIRLHDGAYTVAKAPDVPEVVCECTFIHEMASPFQCSDANDFWDLTKSRGLGHLELSQKGISSRAYKPVLIPREALLHAFDEMVLAREAKSNAGRSETLADGGKRYVAARHGHVALTISHKTC